MKKRMIGRLLASSFVMTALFSATSYAAAHGGQFTISSDRNGFLEIVCSCGQLDDYSEEEMCAWYTSLDDPYYDYIHDYNMDDKQGVPAWLIKKAIGEGHTELYCRIIKGEAHTSPGSYYYDMPESIYDEDIISVHGPFSISELLTEDKYKYLSVTASCGDCASGEIYVDSEDSQEAICINTGDTWKITDTYSYVEEDIGETYFTYEWYVSAKASEYTYDKVIEKKSYEATSITIPADVVEGVGKAAALGDYDAQITLKVRRGNWTPVCELSKSIKAAPYAEPEEEPETPSEDLPEDLYTGVSKEVEVNVSQSPIFSVKIPKKITLDGQTGAGSYEVTATADIPSSHIITIAPAADSLLLSSDGKEDITAFIEQSKTTFSVEQDGQDRLMDGVSANGIIETEDLSAGRWVGNFDFNIFITGGDLFDDTEQNVEYEEI